MLSIRKLQTIREEVLSELGMQAVRPVIRAVGLAVIHNPFAGRFVEDLTPLWEIGASLAERLMPDLVRLLSGPVVSYGKGAVVGVAGEMERKRGDEARGVLGLTLSGVRRWPSTRA